MTLTPKTQLILDDKPFVPRAEWDELAQANAALTVERDGLKAEIIKAGKILDQEPGTSFLDWVGYCAKDLAAQDVVIAKHDGLLDENGKLLARLATVTAEAERLREYLLNAAVRFENIEISIRKGSSKEDLLSFSSFGAKMAREGAETVASSAPETAGAKGNEERGMMNDERRKLGEALIEWAEHPEFPESPNSFREYCIFCGCSYPNEAENHKSDCLHIRAFRLKYAPAAHGQGEASGSREVEEV